MLHAMIRRGSRERETTIRGARAHTPKAPPPDEQYAGAFARVRLVRAWIGAAAAMVALGYAFNTLLDRVLP